VNPWKNYYGFLLCRPTDDQETLKSAYRKIVRRTHTDANDGSEEYRILFEHAVEAWKVLGDPKLRAEYDAERAQWMMDRQAIQCAGCGEALRVTPGARQNCPICKHPVSQERTPAWESNIVRPIVDSGRRIGDAVLDTVLNESEKEAERLGRELVEKSATVLSGLILTGFERARRRLGRRGNPR
jgi:curved DNA-binding protein CbpA